LPIETSLKVSCTKEQEHEKKAEPFRVGHIEWNFVGSDEVKVKIEAALAGRP